MKKTLFLLFFISVSVSLFAQEKNALEPYYMSNPILGYNFFVGNDAKEFTTIPKVLGSGLYDWSFNYSFTPFWIVNPQDKMIGLSFPFGLRFTKYRFSDHLTFGLDADQKLEIAIDDIATHDYNDSYFSYDGSKLVTGNWRFPLFVYFPVQRWFGGKEDHFGIFGTFFYERYAFAYHKLRYDEDSKRVKDVTRNKTFKNYGLNKHLIGVSGGFKIKTVVFFAQYVITPFFDETVGKEINEMRVGISFIPLSKKSNNSTPFQGFDI